MYSRLMILLVTCYAVQGLVWQWPVSRSTTTPDQPQSSAFGPRIQTHDDDWLYDWHTGIELDLEVGTNLYSVADGEVRWTGSGHIKDKVIIQIKHIEGNTTYYSMFVHAYDIYVNEGDFVTRGQLIGTSGAVNATYGHVHFQIRKDGTGQTSCIHPYFVMPHDQSLASKTHSVQLNSLKEVNETHYNVTMQVIQPGDYLALNSIQLSLKDVNGKVLKTYTADFTNMTNSATSIIQLDDPDQFPFYFSPYYFGVDDMSEAKYDVTVYNITLPEDTHELVGYAIDVNALTVEHKVELETLLETDDDSATILASLLALLFFFLL